MRPATCRRNSEAPAHYGEACSTPGRFYLHCQEVIEQDPIEWQKLLKNVVALAKVGAVVSRWVIPQILHQLQHGPVRIDSQEGETMWKTCRQRLWGRYCTASWLRTAAVRDAFPDHHGRTLGTPSGLTARTSTPNQEEGTGAALHTATGTVTTR